MSVTLGWLAIALAGVGTAPEKEAGNQNIVYSLKLIEMDGLAWRETAFSQLQPAARQGSATIWTAPHELTTQLSRHVAKGSKTSVVQAPRITGGSGQPVHVSTRASRQMITQVAWRGEDAPPKITPEKLRVGTMATMTGRKIDQGILMQVVLEDSQILAVHKVSLGRCATQAKECAETAELDAIDCKSDDSKLVQPIVLPKALVPKMMTNTESWRSVKEQDDSKLLVEIPEVSGQEVAGEWLVPNDGILVISLGVHTITGDDGKAIVRERLALLEASETTTDATVIPASTGSIRVPSIGLPVSPIIEPMRVPHLTLGNTPLNIPALPGRSIPQGMHGDGTPAEMPPVPADEVETNSVAESAEPVPSPQAKFRAVIGNPRTKMAEEEADVADEAAPTSKMADAPKVPARAKTPNLDVSASRVEFTLPKLPVLPSWLANAVSSMNGIQFMMPIKPLAIKLPFNQKLEIEIIGKVVPDPDATSR